MTWKMRTELEIQWDVLEEELSAMFMEVTAVVRKGLEEIRDFLRSKNAPHDSQQQIRLIVQHLMI